jgi:hypothetical protein
MSDDVFAIRTTYQDVAELGQGYLERADGERLLLPLPMELSEGEGVRFIVYLADGTPAFAGAGRAVQVSDQGGDVAAEERYETLIDGLVFDERSRPVYDYIVAVRQMAYADLGAAAEAEAANGEEAVLESEEPTTHSEAASPELLEASMRRDAALGEDAPNDTISFSPGDVAPSSPAEPVRAAAPSPATYPPADFEEAQPETGSQTFGEVTPADHNAAAIAAAERDHLDSQIPPALDLPDADNAGTQVVQTRSVMPIATGILRRPPIAVGWQPIAPKRPQPSHGSGMFRYPPGTLPIPAKPPRPDLPPDQRVQPAAAPS